MNNDTDLTGGALSSLNIGVDESKNNEEKVVISELTLAVWHPESKIIIAIKFSL